MSKLREKMLRVQLGANVEHYERSALQIGHVHGPEILTREGLRAHHFTDPRGRLFMAQIIASKESGGKPPEPSRLLELLSATADSGLTADEARSLVFESAVFDALEQNAPTYAKAIIGAWQERGRQACAQELQKALESGDTAAEDLILKRLERLRKASTGGGGLPLLTLDDILHFVPDPADELWPDGLLNIGDPSGIIGAPQAGKSRISLQAAVYSIVGREFLGWKTKASGKKWLFLQTENSQKRLQYDLGRMVSAFTKEERDLVRECLRIVNINALDCQGICMADGHSDRLLISATLDRFNADVVVVDPLRDAGRGDLNSDADMTAALQGLSSLIRQGNSRRTPLIIHHGRTGAVEASRVFGDDAASFARNSKVLYGWLRSQINVARAGVDHPGIVIFGCGKNSNGRQWEPFAAELDEMSMTYRRLSEDEFSVQQWAGAMATGKKTRTVTADDVAGVVKKAGGTIRGGEKDKAGLVQQVMKMFTVSRDSAKSAVADALGTTIQTIVEQGAGHRAPVTYTLKNRPFAPCPGAIAGIGAKGDSDLLPRAPCPLKGTGQGNWSRTGHYQESESEFLPEAENVA